MFVLDRNTIKYRANAVFAKVSSFLDVSPKKKVAVISLVSFLELQMRSQQYPKLCSDMPESLQTVTKCMSIIIFTFSRSQM